MSMTMERQDWKDMAPGHRLEQLLYELRLSQTDLARETNRSPQYVNNIIRQGQGITQEYAQKLARETGVNLNWLLLGVGPMIRCDVARADEAAGEEPSVRGLLQRASEMLEHAADRVATRS